MTKIQVEIHDDVIKIINKIKNINDTGLELNIPTGAIIFDNILSLKLLNRYAEKNAKTLHLETEDSYGLNLIKSLREDFSDEEGIAHANDQQEYSLEMATPARKKLRLPKIKLSLGGSIAKLLILISFVILGGLGFNIISKLPHADIKIVVKSQPLAKSLTLKVVDGQETKSETKVLKGRTAVSTIENTISIDTSGEKIIGEKAKGEIIIFNKTSSEKTFDKGTKITFEDDDDDFSYLLLDDITVPAITLIPNADPSQPGTYENGEASVQIEASEIGSKYNIDKDSTLKVNDYPTSEFEAKTNENIDGGKEETIKTVAQKDIDTLIEKVTTKNTDDASSGVKKSLESGEKAIAGSTKITTIEQTLSKALGEEATEVSIKQSAQAKTLTYKASELDSIMDKVVEEFIPKGFILSTKDRELNVEILGATTNTILTETEADIQVTLKTFVVPDISEEKILEEIRGKSAKDAEKVLGSIQNVNTYEINLSPRIPLLDKIPNDAKRVFIKIERE